MQAPVVRGRHLVPPVARSEKGRSGPNLMQKKGWVPEVLREKIIENLGVPPLAAIPPKRDADWHKPVTLNNGTRKNPRSFLDDGHESHALNDGALRLETNPD